MAERDVTILVNRGLPKTWTCPHCGKRNQMDEYAEEIFLEHFKVIRHCEHCAYLHVWELKLSEDFKRKVVEMLMRGVKP